jgi:hypothetical protein
MPLTLNLLAPWGHTPERPSSYLIELLPAFTGSAHQLLFEHSPGRGNPKFTGDHTAFDALIRYSDCHGRSGFVAFEIKYSESMREPMPELKSRHAELSAASGLFTDSAAAALRTNPLQQFWREHLLAHSMIANGLYDEGYLVTIAPALNYRVQDAAEAYQTHLREPEDGQGPLRQSHAGRRHRGDQAQRPGARGSPASPLLRLLVSRRRAGAKRADVWSSPPTHAPAAQTGERGLTGSTITQVIENIHSGEKLMTNSIPTRLLFRKKITAIYADGSSKMNLGVATVVRMLRGAANVPVEVATDSAARELLDELARSAGRTVERASAGTFLTSPAKQPDREPQAVSVVPTAPVGPKPRRTRGNGKVEPRAVRKYPTLSTTFFKGSIAGQINSVFKTREINPQKVTDFKLALANGDCIWDLLPSSKSHCKP